MEKGAQMVHVLIRAAIGEDFQLPDHFRCLRGGERLTEDKVAGLADSHLLLRLKKRGPEPYISSPRRDIHGRYLTDAPSHDDRRASLLHQFHADVCVLSLHPLTHGYWR